VTAALMFFMRQLARLPLPVLRARAPAWAGCCTRWRASAAASRTSTCACAIPIERGARAGRGPAQLRAVQPGLLRPRLAVARPPAVVRQRLRITGATEDLTRPGAVVMFAPHFYGMDAGGSAVMDQIDRPACTIYSTQSNPAIDAWMRAGRLRFGQATLLSRQEGLKPIVRALREGKMLYLLPDMDLGPQESIFVPFFGIATATVPSLPRFAKLGGARVVPVVTRLTPEG
jgi:KDO2-lipid IV(A) lauroyltransferase